MRGLNGIKGRFRRRNELAITGDCVSASGIRLKLIGCASAWSHKGRRRIEGRVGGSGGLAGIGDVYNRVHSPIKSV